VIFIRATGAREGKNGSRWVGYMPRTLPEDLQNWLLGISELACAMLGGEMMNRLNPIPPIAVDASLLDQ
jgi:hypothetical protein